MDLFRFKKSIKIFMCTVLTIVVMATSALSFSFKSQALTLGAGVDSLNFLSSFYSFLLSGKMVSDSISNPFMSSSVTSSQIDQVMEFFDKCNEYQDGLGDDLKSSIYAGALNGSMTISAEDRENFLEYLEYCKTNDISIPLYKTKEEYRLNEANYETNIVVRYHTNSNPTILQSVITVTANSKYFICLRDTTLESYYHSLFYILTQNNTYPTITVENQSIYTPIYSNTGNQNFTTSQGNQLTSNVGYVRVSTLYNGNPYFIIDSVDVYTQFWPGFGRFFSLTNLADMIASIRNEGVARLNKTTDATVLSDTSDVISATSTVSDQGVIEGPLTITVPEFDTLTKVLYALNNGILSLKDALATLGLSSVRADATPQEKEKAVEQLIEVYPAASHADSQTITIPAGATSIINESVDEVSTVQHIAHSIANTIADIRGVPRPYPDEEPDVGPSGDPHIQGWDFPSLDPDNPDPGGSDPSDIEDDNRASDVINGLAFVSGFISSFYGASKGFNMVFTVGISFVIFSVIIGASHFFGALFGSHTSVNGPSTIKELNASREAQIRVQQRAYQRSLKQHHNS